jgi:hypothetical protein
MTQYARKIVAGSGSLLIYISKCRETFNIF